jgi:hypothetical protein
MIVKILIIYITRTSFFSIHAAHFSISDDLALFPEDALISLRTFLEENN